VPKNLTTEGTEARCASITESVEKQHRRLIRIWNRVLPDFFECCKALAFAGSKHSTFSVFFSVISVLSAVDLF